MIEGVANHMRERIFEMFDDTDVHLDVFALQDQQGGFTVILGDIADGADVLAKRRTHRHHAHLHDIFLKFEGKPFHLILGFERFIFVVAGLLNRLSQAPLGDGNLTGEVEHTIELLGIDADCSDALHPNGGGGLAAAHGVARRIARLAMVVGGRIFGLAACELIQQLNMLWLQFVAPRNRFRDHLTHRVKRAEQQGNALLRNR